MGGTRRGPGLGQGSPAVPGQAPERLHGVPRSRTLALGAAVIQTLTRAFLGLVGQSAARVRWHPRLVRPLPAKPVEAAT